MTQQEVAIQFLEMCAMKSPKAAFEKFTNYNFKHHNQYFPGDRDSLMNAIRS